MATLHLSNAAALILLKNFISFSYFPEGRRVTTCITFIYSYSTVIHRYIINICIFFFFFSFLFEFLPATKREAEKKSSSLNGRAIKTGPLRGGGGNGRAIKEKIFYILLFLFCCYVPMVIKPVRPKWPGH